MIQIATMCAAHPHLPSTAEGKHISFWLDGTPDDRRRTALWVVKSKYEPADNRLGEIRWFSRWRKYAFWPADHCVFEQDCMRDISEFIEDRTKEHMEHARTSKRKQ
jgi:hypothetical protein